MMLKSFSVLLLLIFLFGCEIKIVPDGKIPDGKIPDGKRPDGCCYEFKNNSLKQSFIDIDRQLRERNYAGGSCVHASMITVLRWQNFNDLADKWQNAYSGAESETGLISKADRLKLKIAYTTKGDSDFLEWCSRTRRGAVIFYYPNHAVTFCGFEGNRAILLDNNSVSKFDYINKSTFLNNWKGYGGFALTPVYSPSPPKPQR